ncbi:MAG: hypothetical protein CMP66_04200 [Flavobacteriales bacterium]|nr:hypothetical protein [Flavobacteriales bacterium]|tara:strand:- start:593 stop:1189 length:597 start_codon:yes stop_codon:yes gene_type:complete
MKLRNYLIGFIVLLFLIKCANDNIDNENTIKDTYDQEEKTASNITENREKKVLEFYPTPENGYSPFDLYFGKGIYNNNSGNSFVIKNSNQTHAVVLLVDAYSERKVRNEFIRKGQTFSMTGVPDGTYYLKWMTGNDWSPNIKVGKLKGGFQTNMNFSESSSYKDWMSVSGYQEWTITLYSVSNGNMNQKGINKEQFAN